tara:strand:+ start:294 stop:833 length:540 start_codon:yes stop_codon:yes gene_type:complete
MAVTNVQLKQTISALVSGVGIRTQHSVGGNNILSDDVDIAFGFTLKCGNVSNSITLNYRDAASSYQPTLEHSSSPNDIECDQEIGGSGSQIIVTDPNFTDIPAITTIVAIYFEAPADNTGVITITGTPADVGTVSFTAAGGSVLLVPRFANAATYTQNHVMALSTVNDILKVVVLGKGA